MTNEPMTYLKNKKNCLSDWSYSIIIDFSVNPVRVSISLLVSQKLKNG